MIAHVSQRVPLPTSTRYEAWAISNPSSCYAKVRSLFQTFLTPMMARVSRREPHKTLNYKHAMKRALSVIHLLATQKCGRFSKRFLTNYLLLSKIRLINFSHCTASSRCITLALKIGSSPKTPQGKSGGISPCS